MRNCKRPRLNQEGYFYQTPTDFSEEEIQRSCEFVKKVKEVGDKRIFTRYVDSMKSYQSESLTCIDLKKRVAYTLRNQEGLLEEFHNLLSDLASPRNSIKEKKPDLDRTIAFLNKVEALDAGLYKEFLGAFRSPGDMEALIEQLDMILREHPSLKEEFKMFLIDSRLLKPIPDLEATGKSSPENKRAKKNTSEEECMNVTPSYWIRPDEAEEGSSSSEVLNGKYISVGRFDPEKVVNKKRPPRPHARMDNLEDELFEEDMYLKGLTSVIKFGKDVLCDKEICEKPPVMFNEVIRRFYKGKKVPQIFKTNPKLAVQAILHRLQSMEKNIRETKERKVKGISSRLNRNK